MAIREKARCGTTSGYKAHKRADEEPCDDCKLAKSHYNKQYQLKNLHRYRMYGKKYRDANKEKIKEKNFNRRKNNFEAVKLSEQKYKKAHPEISRAASRKRRATLKFVKTESYSEKDVILTYGTNCYICNVAIDLNAPKKVGLKGWQNGLHIDHVIPISKGGGDTLENVRPTHALCNIKKGDRING